MPGIITMPPGPIMPMPPAIAMSALGCVAAPPPRPRPPAAPAPRPAVVPPVAAALPPVRPPPVRSRCCWCATRHGRPLMSRLQHGCTRNTSCRGAWQTGARTGMQDRNAQWRTSYNVPGTQCVKAAAAIRLPIPTQGRQALPLPPSAAHPLSPAIHESAAPGSAYSTIAMPRDLPHALSSMKRIDSTRPWAAHSCSSSASVVHHCRLLMNTAEPSVPPASRCAG